MSTTEVPSADLWIRARRMRYQLEDAKRMARGGGGAVGGQAAALEESRRAELAALVADHPALAGTWVDPSLSWAELRTLTSNYPWETAQ